MSSTPRRVRGAIDRGGAPGVWAGRPLLAAGDFQPVTRADAFLVDVVRQWRARLTVALWVAPGDPVPATTRLDWLRELTPRARVLTIELDHPAQAARRAAISALRRTVESGEGPVPAAVTGPNLRDRDVAVALGIPYVPVELPGEAVGSAEILADPGSHWDDLADPVRASCVRRVAILGPESTGKTTLAGDLARHYGTLWAPEYLRVWLDAKGATCEPRDLRPVVAGHRAMEAALARRARRVLLLDTDPVMTGVYSRFYYGTLPAWLDRAIAALPAHHYLLLDADVPWVPDPQRDMPHRRHEILALCREELDRRGYTWTLIAGTWAERFARARQAIDALLAAPGW